MKTVTLSDGTKVTLKDSYTHKMAKAYAGVAYQSIVYEPDDLTGEMQITRKVPKNDIDAAYEAVAEATATIRLVGKDEASSEIKKVHGALDGLSVKGVAAGVVLGTLGADALKKVGSMMADFARESVQAAAALELVNRRGAAIFKDAFPEMDKQIADLSKTLGRSTEAAFQHRTGCTRAVSTSI